MISNRNNLIHSTLALYQIENHPNDRLEVKVQKLEKLVMQLCEEIIRINIRT